MRAFLLRVLLVPPEPAPPDGSPESIRIFRAGHNYYRWRLALWALAQTGVLLTFVVLLIALRSAGPRMTPGARMLAQTGTALILVLVMGGAVYSYLLQRMNYEMRWYIVTDRSLRIRSGIWNVEEITMTYANIQNLRIQRDPLQLLLGLADLEVTSAGGGSSSPRDKSTSHTATFSGVEDPEELRDLIVERLRVYRDAGLGDPEAPAALDVNAAVARLLTEARKLRAAVT